MNTIGLNQADPLEGQPEYGNDAGIQYKHRNAIKIVHRTKFATICCDPCNADLQRQYFLITENAIQSNYPTACAIYCPGIPCVTPFWQCCSLPPNSICPGCDNVTHTFFDRGIFDRQSCCWTLGCLSGEPEMYPNEIKHTCCCFDCPTCYNEWASCWWPSCCGERLRYLPHSTFCFCCSSKVTACYNCFGLCGVKTGEPWPCCLTPVANHIMTGEAQLFAHSFTKARNEWCEFTNKK